MNKKLSNYIWGIFIILLGLVLLLKTLNFIDFEIFFDGWWTLFIIIPSLADVIVNDHKITSFNFLLLGLLLLLKSQKIIESPIIIFICILIIELGLKIILGKSPKRTSKNSDNYIGIFGESNSSNNDPDFQGCDIVSVFGTVKLDLTKATIKNDIRIDSINIFGSVYLTVPENVNVKINGINIFGSSYPKKNETNCPYTIYIESVSVFGDIRIK